MALWFVSPFQTVLASRLDRVRRPLVSEAGDGLGGGCGSSSLSSSSLPSSSAISYILAFAWLARFQTVSLRRAPSPAAPATEPDGKTTPSV